MKHTDCEKNKIFDEPHKKGNGVCRGTFSFSMSLQSDHTCCLDRPEQGTCLHFSCAMSHLSFLLFIQQFNSMLSTDSTTVDATNTPTSVDSICPHSSCSCVSRLVGFLELNRTLGTSASEDSSSPSSQHLHLVLQLARCHHHSLDLPAHCSPILVSRLLRNVHVVGFR